MIPGLIWGKVNKEFTVLMYEPGMVKEEVTAEDGSKLMMTLNAETTFPKDGSVTYTVNPSEAKKFAVNFRIPSWAVNYRLSVNGVAQTITGNDEVSINRVWNTNDKVEVMFDMPLQVINGGPSYPGSIAFKRGPQVLAVDSAFYKGNEKAMTLTYKSGDKFAIADAHNSLPKNWVGKQAYIVTFDNIKKNQALALVPFADAGQQASGLQVWIPYTGAGVVER